jgi:hypothetical protein
MDTEALRRLIRDRLASGTLPHDSIPRVWGGPGQGETCQGCEEIVTKPQMLMEGISATGLGIQMHVRCFDVWDHERRAIGHEPSGPSGSGL